MIELRDVHKQYQVEGRALTALQPTSLHINKGEVFGLIGHSGAGKSTLLRLINLLERPSGGQVRVNSTELTALNERDLRTARRQIGMIFQHFNLLARKTVAENIAFPLQIAGESDANKIRQRVDILLDRVGLHAHADQYPAQLSGGQKQRVGIARALATHPDILLCDEATSALDPQTTQSVLQLLGELNRELGLTIVIITHEMDVVRKICDRVAVLDAGRIVEQGDVADVFLHPQHATTRSFVHEAEHIDDAALQASFAHVPGRILQLTFRGDTTYAPTLQRVAQTTGTEFSILSGRIDRIKQLPYGQLIIAVTGNGNDAFSALKNAGVHVEILRA